MAAALLERGVKPHDRVAMVLPTGPDYFRAFLGAWLAGAVPVPMYPPFRADRIEEYVHRTSALH